MSWIRILATCAIVTVVAAGALAGASLERPSADPVEMASARDGDAWTYAQQDFVNGTPVDGPVLRSFERIGPTTVLSPDGGMHGGSGVRERAVTRTPCGTPVDVIVSAVATIDGPLGHIVEGDVAGGGCARTQIVGGPVEPQDEAEVYDVEDRIVLGRDPLPCGHTNSLAGAIAGPVATSAGTCSGDLRRIGIDGQDVVYEDEEGRQLWFDPDVPVPVRIRAPQEEGVRVLELQEFSPGDAPVRYAADEDGPGLDVSPSERGRPASDGFVTEFSLDDALEHARTDDTFARLLDHGFLMEASYTTVHVRSPDGDSIERTWELRATDGKAARGLRVQATETHDDAATAVPLWDATREARTEITVEVESWPDDGPFPDPERIPTAMPSVAGAIALWQDLGGGAPDAFAFQHSCAGQGCNDVQSSLTVGRMVGERVYPGPCISCVIEAAWDVDTLTVDAQGRIQEASVRHGVQARQTDLLGAPEQAPQDPGEAEATPVVHAQAYLPVPVAAGVTAAAIVAGLGYVAYVLVKSGAFALSQRVDAHPLRREIVQLVQNEPGIHHKELMRRLDRGNHVVSHHVRRLVGAGLVVQQAGPRFTCYFPRGRIDRRVMAAAPILKSGMATALLQEIDRHPGRSGRDLADALGVAPGSITFHAKRMAKAGLIDVTRDGRSLAYRATDIGRNALSAGLAA